VPPVDAQKEPAAVPAPADGQKEPAQARPAADAPKQKSQDASPPDDQKEMAPASTEALSVRYRFIEKYSPNEDSEKRDAITQYRVGVRERFKRRSEKAQGAPDQSEESRQTIYTERAAHVSKLGEVTDSVRRYDYDVIHTRETVKSPSLQGLTILYHRRAGDLPQILNLTSDRPLRESDYDRIRVQVFVPQLMALFPTRPARVGDTWEISPQLARLVWSEQPQTDDYELTGRLIEVGKAATTGSSLTAVIGVSGRFTLNGALNLFNAKIYFTFDPPTAATGLPAGSGAAPATTDNGPRRASGKRDEGIHDARGRINIALMAQTAERATTDGESRLKQYETHELHLERRPQTTNDADGSSSGLKIPVPIPTADVANSWLLYDDPKGRIHFRHPQELGLSPSMTDPDVLEFHDRKLEMVDDVFVLRLARAADDPQRARLFRDAEQFRREIDEDWAKRKVDVVRGPAGWLSAEDWEPLKVYRKELGVKTAGVDEKGGRVERVYIDYYLVLSKANDCVRVESYTKRDNHVAFRTDVERMIKSFRIGRAGERPGAGSVRPSPTSPERSSPPP
jgi:hypothetical protein